MCGIYGALGTDTGRLARAAEALSHRGPDFAGTYADQHLTLGHRLLSIRDDDTVSRQPVTKEGSPWVLLFNGQLYNTESMKRALPASYASTALDTTLLYGLIERFGWDFIGHIQGMFAIALYHREERVLRLYRDQAGQKPIYYTTSGGFAFASEIRGLRALATTSDEVDTAALAVATTLGYVPGSATLLRDIRKVAPSECVTYRIDTGTTERAQYVSRDENHFDGAFEDVMQQLIVEHLAGKEQIALNLSGGLDSSLILHEASRAGYQIETYTTRFADSTDAFNADASLATQLARDYGTTHTEIAVDSHAYRAAFYESYETIEEPNFNLSVPVYFLTAKREGVHADRLRVILSGDGGDEVFCGYSYYLRNLRDDRLAQIVSPPLFDLVRNARNHLLGFRFANPIDRWLYYKFFRTAYSSDSGRLATTLAYLRAEVSPYLDAYAHKPGSLYGSMVMDRAVWLPGENFIRSDKLFMSQSAEMRSPLAYQPFRTYADSLLTDADYTAGGTNKQYLRSRYRGKLPAYITDRAEKSGWRAPIVDWYDAAYRDLFLAPVAEARNRSQGLIDWSAVEQGIRDAERWPGKQLHFYSTLAVLSNAQNLRL